MQWPRAADWTPPPLDTKSLRGGSEKLQVAVVNMLQAKADALNEQVKATTAELGSLPDVDNLDREVGAQEAKIRKRETVISEAKATTDEAMAPPQAEASSSPSKASQASSQVPPQASAKSATGRPPARVKMVAAFVRGRARLPLSVRTKRKR